eukprot:tig00000718_g3715.t1
MPRKQAAAKPDAEGEKPAKKNPFAGIQAWLDKRSSSGATYCAGGFASALLPWGPHRAGPVGVGVGAGACLYRDKVYFGVGFGSHGGPGWSWPFKQQPVINFGVTAGLATGWGIGVGMKVPWLDEDEANLDELVAS